jgi:hypothetical protein
MTAPCALADQSPVPSVGRVEVYDEEGKVASTVTAI